MNTPHDAAHVGGRHVPDPPWRGRPGYTARHVESNVVITGVGAVTAFGVGIEALWDGLLKGESRLRPITRFDASAFPSKLGAEVTDFSARNFVPKTYRKAVKVMARDIELAVGAAKCAVEDAGLSTKGCPREEGAEPTYPARRVGCHIGAGLIAAELDELTGALATAVDENGEFSLKQWGDSEGGDGAMGNLQPLWLLKYLPNMLACHVTIIHDAQGPSNTITCAEASGVLSVGESLRVIQRGDADLCFSGGAENKISEMGLLRMDLAGRLAHTGDATDGSTVVRPFDPDATGGLLGEGGGILMLERESCARDRGATIYARVSGFGAGHAPRSDDDDVRSKGLRFAIERAINDAGISPDDIDAVLPHASGIPALDREEIAALRAVFGDRLKNIPLVTITPNIGDTMAGHGSLAIGVGAMCVRRRTFPARLHAGTPLADLDAGAADVRDASISHMLVCTNALGGQNGAVVLSTAPDRE